MSDYDPLKIEKKWHKKWEKIGINRFDREKVPVYSIDNPPRYASGALHIGHAVHYTHIDFVARYKRMKGYNVFFPLCFDVNGIPIEERVERKYGITRKDIDRHEFISLCSKFAEKNIEEMIKQFMMLGESMDPSIYYQTDAEYFRRITQISFIELFERGHIYKGEFPVNWCPRCMTAMADAEIEHIERDTKLNTVRFYFAKEQPSHIEKYHGIGRDKNGQYIEIATTRPEMFPTCQLVAVHPDDERTPWLLEKEVIVPFFEKKVKIVEDESVDPHFGTGIVMVCTVGDKDDLEWAFRYSLPMEICIHEDGTMNELAGKYEGMLVENARREVIKDLKINGLLIKQEKLKQSIGVCWRCKTPVEFIQTGQWFLKLLPFKKKVLEASNNMQWYPGYMERRLEEWVDSLKWDWVISRQRYFATPIPLWECIKCGEVVVANKEQCYVDPTIDSPPCVSCPKCGGELKGCEDVFDTWMDSSITPLFNTFWERDSSLFTKLYPMSLRPQAHDIIRTWAFYTILRCTLITGKKPFEEVMMGGFILDPDGKPMHTSLGNVINPLEILNQYGADALRYYAVKCKLGEDNPFRYKDLIRGQRLMKKIWNVERFIGNAIKEKKHNIHKLRSVDKWILHAYSNVVRNCTADMDNFSYSDAIREIEYFLWHEFADHYLEMVKHRIYEENDEAASYILYTIGLGILKLLAPFLPFITEEIYHSFYKKYEENESIHISQWPLPLFDDKEAFKRGEHVKEIIAKIREYKSTKGVPLSASIKSATIYGSSEDIKMLESSSDTIQHTLNIEQFWIKTGIPHGEEVIIDVKPAYSKLGPVYKEITEQIIDKIKDKNPQELYREICEKGEILIPDVQLDRPVIIPKDYINFEKEFQIKGKKAEVIDVGAYKICIER